MPNRPLLVFPKPIVGDPESENSPRRKFSSPYDKEEQAQRISEQFDRILAQFQLDPSGDIEKILVVETIGTLADFRKAVEKINKLEWLAEIDEDEIDVDLDEAKTMEGRLCLAATNVQAVKILLGLWKEWKDERKLRHGYGAWKGMFEQIHVIRLWNHKDMLRDTGFLDEFEEIIKKGETADRKTEIDFEVELHYRNNPLDRDKAQREAVKEIRNAGGKVTGFVHIEEVRFHGLKISLPIATLQSLISKNDASEGELIDLLPSWVKYCRPMSMIREVSDNNITEENGVTDEKDMTFPDCNDNPPIIALLDGVPILNHKFLDARMEFDDPDNCSSEYEGNKGKGHGTAMASLICHGDLNAEYPLSLSRKIYVRPILVEDNTNIREITEKIRDKIFLEDIIMRSVKRMFEDIDGEPAVAKKIRIINLSIGNIRKVFLHEVSPAAKVLDYLSWKYKVLFIISAGNQFPPRANFDFNGRDKDTENNSLISAENRITSGTVIRAVDKRQKEWRIIEPAESINGLTVGAVNDDSFDEATDERNFDPLKGHCAVALYSRLGAGFRGQIKPDILVAGGKSHYMTLAGKSNSMLDGKFYYVLDGKSYYRLPNGQLKQNANYRKQGLVSAYPDSSAPEKIDGTWATFGTSNSTALATHTAGELYEILEEIRNERPDSFDEKYNVLLIKALLAHGASRADISSIYKKALKNPTNSRKWELYFSRYCGYGIPDFERVKECTDYRVVTLGYGDIEEKKCHKFSLPLPLQCSKSIQITLTVTLAWFSPMVLSHQLLRQAKLFFKVSGISDLKRLECNWQQVKKGTLQHEIFAVNRRDFSDHEQIDILVHCYAAMGHLDQAIPYGLAVTLEVSNNINIYEDIKNEITPKVSV